MDDNRPLAVVPNMPTVFAPSRAIRAAACENFVCRIRTMVVIGPMTSGASGLTEVDAIRWVWVAVGVLGTVVAASNGAALIASRLLSWLRPVGRYLHCLARMLRFRQPSAPVLTGSGRFTATSQLTSTLTVTHLWDAGATIETKVTALHEEFKVLRQRINKLERDGDALERDLGSKINEVATECREKLTALQRRLDQERQEGARVDARGLPLIGISIILSGLPNGLARVAVVGWLFVASSGAVAVIAVRSALLSRRASA